LSKLQEREGRGGERKMAISHFVAAEEKGRLVRIKKNGLFFLYYAVL